MNSMLRIVYHLTKAELKSRYRNTFAGFLWVAINPLLSYLVHAVIFSVVFKVQVPNYLVFLLGGLFPWIFVSTSLAMHTNCFVANRDILLSFKISPPLILASKITDNFINFIIPFGLVGFVLFLLSKVQLFVLLLVILPTILIFIATYSFTLLLATLQIFYRDTLYVVNFVLSMIFLLTPIIYPISFVPERFVFLEYLNPFFLLFHPFQIAIWKFEMTPFCMALGRMGLLTGILVLFAAFTWTRKRKKNYLYI